MSAEVFHKDLVLLVADKDMEFTLKGLLSRPQSLGVRPVTFDVFVHDEHDPGCLRRSHELLRSSASRYEHALVLLDHKGSGREDAERSALESEIERRLGETGWADRAAAIVIAPELENWFWSDSPHVDRALGWKGRPVPLRDWLRERGFVQAGALKPSEPKRSVDMALRTVRKAHSSAIYFDLARTVSTKRCTDPAFLKLRWCLREWFAEPPAAP